ncbi:MAG: class I SAM-dependent methyltransferase [bacterium]|nr:class I SAM-dependent methyltransferase [bacterium]
MVAPVYFVGTPDILLLMKKLIEEYNNLLSDKYDTATQGEFKWLAPVKLYEYIRPYIKNGAEVLDVGVGTGQTSKIFINKGLSVIGVDISEKMLAVAQSKLNFTKLIKYDVEQGLLNIFPQDKFDIVVAVGVLEFIKDIKKTLSEMRQLLKNGGIIAFTYEIYEPNNKYGIEKIAPLGAGSENVPELLNFMVYRRLPNEVDKILRDLSLGIINREKFIGYLRSQLKFPVLYEILVVS